MKYWITWVLLLVALLFTALIAGCSTTADIAYHFDVNSSEVCSKSCKEESFEIGPTGESLKYYLGIVEFDDQGLYHHRLQRNAVLDWLQGLLTDDDAVIISYSHGWTHNAAPGASGDLVKFREVLQNQVLAEKQLTDAINYGREDGQKINARKVIGLYTGWRGSVYNNRYLDKMSFWNRKKTAQLVGLRDAKDYFSGVDSIVRNHQGDGSTRLIITGHSFGALLVHSAITGQVISDLNFQSAKTDAEISKDGDYVIPPYNIYGDQVILINPAFEAMDISNLVRRASEIEYSQEQRPLYLLMSSESDSATGYWFKIGRFFSTFFRNYNDNSNEYFEDSAERKKADRTAIGSYAEYMPYRLELVEESDFSGVQWVHSDLSDSPLFEDLCEMWRSWRSEDKAAHLEIRTDSGQKYSLRHRGAGDQQIKTPFVFATVDPDILDGHGLSDGDRLWAIINRLVVFGSAAQENLNQCSAFPPFNTETPIDMGTIKR